MSYFLKKKDLIFFTILFLAFLARIILSPLEATSDDVLLFEVWSYGAVTQGVTNLYDLELSHFQLSPKFPVPKANYLPLYLYVLKLDGEIWQHFFDDNFSILDTRLNTLLKLNPIIFDLLTGILLFYLVKKMTKKPLWSYLAMILYLFNPGIIYDSAYWGQVDAINTFFLLLSVFLLTEKKFSWAWFFYTISIFIKLQGIFLLPLFLFLTLREKAWKGLATSVGTSLVILFPFIVVGKISSVFRVIFDSPGFDPVVSMNAYNIWWYFSKGWHLAVSDKGIIFGSLSYYQAGYFLLFLSWVAAILYLRKNKGRLDIYQIAAFLAFSFFMLPTEMHERYLFPIFVFLILIVWQNKKYWWLFLGLSLTFFFNLILVNEPETWPEFLKFSLGKSYIVTTANVILYLYFIYLLIMSARQEVKKIT